MKKYDALDKIANLRDRGILSEEEFQREKLKILQGDENSFSRFFQPPGEQLLFGLKEDKYCMLIHLSQFLFFIPPLSPFGIAVPVFLWFFDKEKSEWIDLHGRVLFNWWISLLIYFVVCVGLLYVFIGAPLMLGLLALAIIFPIVVAVKASEGILWTYPLSFDFFGVGKPEHRSNRNSKSQAEPNRKPSDEKPSPNAEMHFNPDKYQSPSISDKYS